MSSRRAALTAVLVGLAALVAADVVVDDAGADRFGLVAAGATPEAGGAGALTSTWYCAAGTAVAGGTANLAVTVANVGDDARAGTITWLPAGAAPVVVPLEVEPDAAVTIAAHPSVNAPAVSAIVAVDGGGVAVEHSVSGGRGASVAPCASSPSATWYLANGTTERDARQVLAVFNPFPDDAVVDISFDTDEGRQDPRALQGLPVPPRSTTFVNVHDHVRRRAVTAASVVARRGRVVVDRVVSFDGALGRTGVSLSLAAPAASEVWWFPDGLVGDGISQSWHIYNPTDEEAVASLEVVPDEGAAPEPVDLTLPPRTQVVVTPDQVPNLPAGVAHSSVVRSLNGVPVVAERALDVRRPSARRGWSSMLGSPVAADEWVLPVGEVSGNVDQWVVVHNPGVESRSVSVFALVGGRRLEVSGLQDLDVGPAGRIALRMGEHIERFPLPLLVVADGDVVVERDAYRVGRSGVSTVIGIPLGG